MIGIKPKHALRRVYLFIYYYAKSGNAVEHYQTLFEERHSREFGLVFLEKEILIDSFRVRAVGSMNNYAKLSPLYQQLKKGSPRQRSRY